jgi:hypothetical protein
MEKESPRRYLQGPVGVKNEGRSLFIFYNLKNIYNKLSSQGFFVWQIIKQNFIIFLGQTMLINLIVKIRQI